MCKREYPELHTGTSTSQSTPILLNKPLSTILWRIGCTHSVWRFTQVYDIVNESVYQVYSKFRIQNCELSLKLKSAPFGPSYIYVTDKHVFRIKISHDTSIFFFKC